jgi:hypothetical protein
MQWLNSHALVMSLLLQKTIKFSCATEQFFIGCYRFCDGSFMKYLDYNKTNVPLCISAPIFEQNDGKCDVWEKFKFIRDSQEWKDGNGRLFSITDKTKELKVNRKRTMPEAKIN